MSGFRSPAVATPRRLLASDGSIRLDWLTNPYGPSVQVQDLLAGSDELHLPSGPREARLHVRLAQQLGVPPERLLLANGMDELLGMVCLWRRERGPLVLFPPSDPTDERRAVQRGMDVIRFPRAASFALDLDLDACGALPRGTTALITAPNDPTGTPLGAQDAVRLLRSCELVVIDERHGEYSGRTLLPLVGEFDNLLVLQSYETWAGLTGLPFAYAIGPPPLLRALSAFRRPGGVTAGAVVAAWATLDDLAYVRATARRVREERGRLFRMLRKLNVVRPHPSWANFVLARVERGDADGVARELARRGIQVHRPAHPELSRALRISATRPEQTDALKRALIEIAAEL